jgi:hypothetical protein
MPYSYNLFKEEVKQNIINTFQHDINILDVGAGCGTYSNLLKDNFPNMDGIEIFEEYVHDFNLKSKYNNIFIDDILEFDIRPYDLFIMGDVVEHLTFVEAKNLIEKIHRADKFMMIAVPYKYEQGVEFGNVYEIHKQPDLTKELFLERYPCMKFLIGDDHYGYFVNY